MLIHRGSDGANAANLIPQAMSKLDQSQGDWTPSYREKTPAIGRGGSDSAAQKTHARDVVILIEPRTLRGHRLQLRALVTPNQL
jgi:hypothetical protein